MSEEGASARTVTDAFLAPLRCPACGSPLKRVDDSLACMAKACARRYPIISGIPVLIDDTRSLFSIADYVDGRDTFWATHKPTSRLKKAMRRLMPTHSINPTSNANYAKFERLLRQVTPTPIILIVGGRQIGQGAEPLVTHPDYTLYETDVSFGPRTNLICDAHELPFVDGFFDAVVCQAVLEHVVDPVRCVEEIHRVLKPAGLVYAESPFMQQVHAGRYDFFRFSPLAHRRLFRRFSEIESGVACGPGMALTWSIEYFILSFTTSRRWRRFLWPLATLVSFGWKYFDLLLVRKEGALDACSGVYFMGQRSERTLSDRDLLKLYRGGS